MTIPAETLMAYVDGELAPEDRARVDAEIARDPALKTYVERQQILRRGLHDADVRLPRYCKDVEPLAPVTVRRGARKVSTFDLWWCRGWHPRGGAGAP